MRSAVESDDAALVSQSLAGSREAFGRIVEQYQSLVCSLAYSATGSLTQSEDLAQETFVIAWKQLRQLREPEKLRSWLCSIARSVISNAVRRQIRQPTHAAETMDTAAETPATDALPSEHAIQREEEAILWRSLEQIPDLYREPLVLFYRRQQSVACVAAELELSEDAVKQRLSRGRKLLTDEIAAFVEGTLERTNPGKAFTLGVLAALPVFTTSARATAIGAAAAKGSATAKAAASVGLFGAFLGPLVGITTGVMGTRMDIKNARSPRERRLKVKMAWLSWSLTGTFNLVFVAGTYFAGPYWQTHPVLIAWITLAVMLGYVLLIISMAVWSEVCHRRLAREENMSDGPFGFSAYRSPWTLLGLPLIDVRFGRINGRISPARGWIACGNVAYGILFATGGLAFGGISIGGVAFGGIAIGGGTLGLLAFGGLAVGLLAVGGAALGYLAYGGTAIAWFAASGGDAVARHLAWGRVAVAPHANDDIARTFIHNSLLFTHVEWLMDFTILTSCLCVIPCFIHWRKQLRRQKAAGLTTALKS